MKEHVDKTLRVMITRIFAMIVGQATVSYYAPTTTTTTSTTATTTTTATTARY